MTCSFNNVLSVQSFDNLKNISKPTTSWGMDEHPHVQSGGAHTNHPSALLQSHSAHLIYYNKSIGKSAQPFQERAQPFQEGAQQFQEGAQQFQEGAPEQDAPQNYYTTGAQPSQDEYLHVQSGCAHTDHPSALLQSRSIHLMYYSKSIGKRAHQFQEGAPEQDAPPNHYTETPLAQRNPFKPSAPQPEL